MMIERLLQQYPCAMANPVAGMIFTDVLVAIALECGIEGYADIGSGIYQGAVQVE